MFIRRFIIVALLLAVPGIVRAQGSRKDDIVLNRFGQPVAGASITVCTAGATGTPCSPLAGIFSDVALTQPLANPLTSDGQGNYHFYAAPGRYLIQISGAGAAVTTIPDVILAADPTSPSFQSLSVTQNINALNLNLSGNLTVSGGVSSPTTVSAPQQGSAPVQIGPHWYAGTATGLCSVPAAPAVSTEAISSGTGNFTSAQTYYVEVRIGNRNGWTPASPPTAYTPASGSTNRMVVQLSDDSYRSGCFKYQVQVSTTGAGGPYYPAQAWTLPVASISSWTCNAGKLCTVTTTATHAFNPGEYVTIAGAATGTNSTTINGSWTLIGQQGSTPTAFFFLRASATADSSGTAAGTATVIAGLGSDPSSHLAPGDFIVAAVPGSGTAFGATNTATIDPDQVALNATCNYANNTCVNGKLIYPQGVTAGTTPLIVSNQQTITGVTSALAYGKSERSCAWADPNIGCVMVVGTANGVRIEGLDIESAGHALLFYGGGPGYGSSNDFIRNNSITTGDLSGRYSAVYIHGGVWYDMHFDNNLLNGGLADVQIDAISGGWLFFSGARWNGANLSPSGLATNAMLATSGPSDPDRGIIRAGFAGAASTVEISNIIYESGTGVVFDVPNLGLGLKNVTTADSAAIAGTPCLIRIGVDANSGPAFNFNFHIEDTVISAVSGVSTTIKVVNPAGSSGSFGPLYVANSNLGANPTGIDMNNTGNGYICVNSIGCNSYPGNNTVKNMGVSAPGSGLATGAIGSNAGEYAYNQLSMGTHFTYKGNSDGWYFWPLSPARWGWFGSDPASCSNPPMDWSFAGGGRFRYYENDCTTVLFDINSSGGANQINLGNPGSPANNKINLGLPLVDSSGATVKGALAAATSSLGGSALSAGACTSGTVSVTGATTGMAVSVSPAADPGAGFAWMGFVSSSGTVTVRVCAIAAGTPTSTSYNVRVIQ